MLIGLLGYAGSGKDTAASALENNRGWPVGWRRVAFADPLRELALRIDPTIPVEGSKLPNGVILNSGMTSGSLSEILSGDSWENSKRKIPAVREFLQKLGTACRETFGKDCWVDIARKSIEDSVESVVVTDCRFPNEFEMIKNMGGHLVRVSRPGCRAVNGHVSESFIAKAKVNATLLNVGSEQDLRRNMLKTTRRLFG
jgi:hypothetical protein